MTYEYIPTGNDKLDENKKGWEIWLYLVIPL